jgi:tRNA threonylcarbamoyladenosine biosynthesis protein TsaE
MHVWTVKSLEELTVAAEQIGAALPSEGLVAIVGEMGAGKTTLIAHICAFLGVTTTVSSPTYGLVNSYLGGQNRIIYHMDLYRIQDIEELIESGIEEHFYESALVFVEWPQIAMGLLPEPYWCLLIKPLNENQRQITLQMKNIDEL